MLKKCLASAALFALSLNVMAADHEVKMLNAGKDGTMVFEPAVLKIAKGDTVTWVPTDMGHDVSSTTIPAGAKPFKGAMNQKTTVIFDTEGTYAYNCTPHAMMAMMGIIVVGDGSSNYADVKAALEAKLPTIVINKERVAKYLEAAK